MVKSKLYLTSVFSFPVDDGKISRLEMPLDDEDDSDLDTGRDLITPVNCMHDPGFDIDTKLR